MRRLFEAYFRVAREEGREILNSMSLPLDLPRDGNNRYHFRARFTPNMGWVVEAGLKHEFRKVVCRQVWNLPHEST
jgi:hypothetical protein